MLLKLFEFLGLRHSPEEIEMMRSCNARFEAACARHDGIDAIWKAIGTEALDKRKQLMIDNIPKDDPRWVLEVPFDIWASAQSEGCEMLAGLRLVPMVNKIG